MTKLDKLKLAWDRAAEEWGKAEDAQDEAKKVSSKAESEWGKAYNAYRDELKQRGLNND
tara:strand:+ start:392 stop:568 length:177 start_codon:yes stop_codon:yes gene_type:complete